MGMRDERDEYKKIGLPKPPLPWREQIEKSRIYRSTYSWDDFNSQQHKSRLQVFQRRTGLAEHVDVDRDALKKSLKRSKKVKSQDAMSIDSWTSNASKEIRNEEKKLFDLQRTEMEERK